MREYVTVIESIGTATPPQCGSQEFAAAFMQRVESLPESIRSRIPMIYGRSGIERRCSCVQDYAGEPEDFQLFPKNWSLLPSPSTAVRNRKYRESVVPVAEEAARRALQDAGTDPGEITHLIFVSCTGFFAPGPDFELIGRLGLRPDVERTLVGFMGCFAAFPALRLANAFCTARTDARVLLVCAELCTVHFQVNNSLENAVVNAIFADGAAAAVIRARPATERAGKLAYVDGYTTVVPNTREAMTWDLGETGFDMGLSSRVPIMVAGAVTPLVEALLARNERTRQDVDFWAIHPGGRAIVDKVVEVLGLEASDVAESYGVLRDYGNMSAPTILFILKQFLDRARAAAGDGLPGPGTGVAMAFGPGLTLESALFEAV